MYRVYVAFQPVCCLLAETGLGMQQYNQAWLPFEEVKSVADLDVCTGIGEAGCPSEAQDHCGLVPSQNCLCVILVIPECLHISQAKLSHCSPEQPGCPEPPLLSSAGLKPFCRWLLLTF